MEQKKGVFSPCKLLDSASMIKCLQALLSDYPSIKFHSVIIDKKHQGFKVFFTEPEYSVVLRKNMISTNGQPVWIYPLTSYLFISDVDYRKSPLFERDLRISIEKTFGRVIEIVKTESSNRRKNWRIEIDIPEFKGLDVFKGKFTGLNLLIPIRNERVVLDFWCRDCKKHEHFQHECLNRANTAPSSTSEEDDTTDKENDEVADETFVSASSRSNESSRIKLKSKTEPRHIYDLLRKQASSSSDQSSTIESESNIEPKNIPDLLEQNAGLFSVRNSQRKPEPEKISDLLTITTDRLAEEFGTEEARSFDQENETHRQNNATVNEGASTNSNLLTKKYIKKENKELAQGSNKEMDVNFGSGISDISSHSNYTTSCKNENNENSGWSSKTDDKIEIIECVENSIVNKSLTNASNSSVREESGNFEEESKSPESKTTPVFSFSGVAGPSNDFSSTTLPSQRGAEVTTALSERLQDCINKVCTTFGVLDRKKLDAFLIHVKKKSNPIRVALNYTTNTKGLKEQLQSILHMYYNTPQTGTKEDIQFIKWLNGLVDRYDGSIPKKRKRSSKTDNEPATKK